MASIYGTVDPCFKYLHHRSPAIPVWAPIVVYPHLYSYIPSTPDYHLTKYPVQF